MMVGYVYPLLYDKREEIQVKFSSYTFLLPTKTHSVSLSLSP